MNQPDRSYEIIINIIINKVLIKVTLNKVIAGALYIVICGWNTVKVLDWQLTIEWQLKHKFLWCQSTEGRLILGIRLQFHKVHPTALKIIQHMGSIKQNKMLSYRRETALQGALQFSPKVEDWNWETIFYGHYRSIFNHNRPENLSNSVKKRKIRAITAFKVIQGHRGRYQSKARMRFPVSD